MSNRKGKSERFVPIRHFWDNVFFICKNYFKVILKGQLDAEKLKTETPGKQLNTQYEYIYSISTF